MNIKIVLLIDQRFITAGTPDLNTLSIKMHFILDIHLTLCRPSGGTH
ncbi:Uncharacterised protein [Vibrio cholerae]|nr:Uncharacterised protein [Vibrio cholerae]CSI45836.1 Uncharacterised protein [Vibrio cholerae]